MKKLLKTISVTIIFIPLFVLLSFTVINVFEYADFDPTNDNINIWFLACFGMAGYISNNVI